MAFKRGTFTLEKAKLQFQDISKEQAQHEALLQSLQAAKDLTDAYEMQIKEAEQMLEIVKLELAIIESEDNEEFALKRKRRLIEALVADIVCYTFGSGRAKGCELRVHFRLGSTMSVDDFTDRDIKNLAHV